VRDSLLKQIRVRGASVVGELSAWHDDWNLGPNAVDIDNLPKCWANLHNQPSKVGVNRRQPRGFPVPRSRRA
jgi:hypothetical protein